MKTTIVFLFIITVAVAMSDLPNGFKVCHLHDPHIENCVAEAIKIALGVLAKGNREFRILPIDPLEVDYLTLDNDSNSLSLKQEFRDIKVYGLSNPLQVSIQDFHKDTLSFHMEILYPRLDIIANYKSEGKLLMFSIHGHGGCNVSMSNPLLVFDIKTEKYEKNGEKYIKYKKFNEYIKQANIILYFENLIDGHPELGETMNKVLNENSELVFSEFKTTFEKIFQKFGHNISSSILQKIPYRKLYPDQMEKHTSS